MTQNNLDNFQTLSLALRAYADEMPKAVNKLKESNDKLIRTYNSVKDHIGPRNPEILSAIMTVKKFVDDCADPITDMQRKMNEKADQIDSWIKADFNGGKNP
ncbi:MAG: hypothetical protein IJI41_03160 [Anaerolineaceae bacterium]|nr:hypothetical protein [Anaerolineaceae bacterium]